MGDEGVFEGARTTFTFFNAYRGGIAKALGEEKALALENGIFTAMGEMQGKTLKEQAGDTEFDLKSTTEVVKEFVGNLGIPFEVIEESPSMVKFKCGRCPVYEGSMGAGFDEKTRETMCNSGPLKSMDAMVRQLNPNISYQLTKYRSAPDDFCEEAIILSKS